MTFMPNDQCWRTELSCGHVLVFQSAPDKPPTGIYICPVDGDMTSIATTKRWDVHMAERLKNGKEAE